MPAKKKAAKKAAKPKAAKPQSGSHLLWEVIGAWRALGTVAGKQADMVKVTLSKRGAFLVSRYHQKLPEGCVVDDGTLTVPAGCLGKGFKLGDTLDEAAGPEPAKDVTERPTREIAVTPGGEEGDDSD